jgi:hypothetical protein
MMYSVGVAVMVRKQVYIEPGQEHFLKRRAAELGVTEADLIRQGISLLAQAPVAPALDPDAWADEEVVLEQRAGLTPGQPERWRFGRDEVYRERLGCVSG